MSNKVSAVIVIASILLAIAFGVFQIGKTVQHVRNAFTTVGELIVTTEKQKIELADLKNRVMYLEINDKRQSNCIVKLYDNSSKEKSQ